jgi:hypothetical protein
MLVVWKLTSEWHSQLLTQDIVYSVRMLFATCCLLVGWVLRAVCCVQHVIQLARAKGLKTINVIRDRCTVQSSCCL